MARSVPPTRQQHQHAIWTHVQRAERRAEMKSPAEAGLFVLPVELSGALAAAEAESS